MAEAVAQTHPWKERPHALGRAVKAIGEDPFDPVRRLLLGGRTLKGPIGLGESCRAGLFRVAQMPEHTAADNRREIPLGGETAAVLLIGQKIDRQRQPTAGQHGHETVVATRTDEAVERHRRDMIEHGAQLQTEAAVRGQQGIPGHLWTHLAVAQDKMRQDGEHRTTRGALDPPDGDATQADTGIMRVARQAPTAVTGRLVKALKAEGEEEREYAFNKGLAVAKQLKVGRFVSKIDGDSPVFTGPFGGCAHVSPLCHQVLYADETQW